MIVVDASAVVSALIRGEAARQRIGQEQLHGPHLLDTEVTDALRKLVLRTELTVLDATSALRAWSRLGVRRHPINGLLDRIWALRHNLSAYDASYVALAEALDCSLVTADRRLAGASGARCIVETVPR